MHPSIIEALTTVSNALATVDKPDELAPVAAQAVAKALGCQTAEVWLFWKNGSRPEAAQLRLAGPGNRPRRAWRRPFAKPVTERTTLADLPDGWSGCYSG